MASKILTSQELDHLLTIHPALSEPSTAMLDSPILKLLASTGRQSLAELMMEQYYVPGEIVFRENDTGDAMYIVRSGRVAVVKGDFTSPTFLSYHGIGEIIGEMALLEDQPRSASVVALEDLRLLRISRENFRQVLSSNPTLGMSMLKAFSTRLRAANEARSSGSLTERRLVSQVSKLQTEKQQLLELQRLREETIDLIIHDLRNPLSLVLGAVNMLEIMLPEDILQANEELLELASMNCEHMKRLVESLLDVAQMEAGEAQLFLAATNLPRLMKKTVDRMAAFPQRDDITIQASIPTGLPTVVMDREKIGRVLANLVDNAVKYTLHGGQVTVAAELQDENVLVSVTNAGPTIPAEDRERIFERFAQSAQGESRTRGFGLGLAFCRLAVEAHGGRIWIEPGEEGIGNRFVFSLPLPAHPQKFTIAT